MPFSAPVLEDGIAASPRLYAAAFRSKDDRFKGLHPEKVQITNLEYDIDLFDTASNVQVMNDFNFQASPFVFGTNVTNSKQRSHRKLAAVFRPPSKSEPNTAIWKFEKVCICSLQNILSSFMPSQILNCPPAHFPLRQVDDPVYNTDAGNRATLFTATQGDFAVMEAVGAADTAPCAREEAALCEDADGRESDP